MVDSKLIHEWLEKADEDFEFASSVIEDTTFYARFAFISIRQLKNISKHSS